MVLVHSVSAYTLTECVYTHTHTHTHTHTEGISGRKISVLEGDSIDYCEKKCSYEHV
jgi:hypothetical protein